jgi:hypothetical protein
LFVNAAGGYANAANFNTPGGLFSLGSNSSSLDTYPLTALNFNLGAVPTNSVLNWNRILGLGGCSIGSSNKSWDLGISQSVATGHLGFCSFDTSNFSSTRTLRGYIANNAGGGPLNFTGQHRCFPASDSLYPLTSNIGKIVIATGAYQSMPTDGSLVRGISSITISESLPLVNLSTRAKEKCCFGVICDVEDFDNREDSYGNFVSPFNKTPGDTRIFINSLGEGAIWVCEANGAVENGDYITTSAVPGYGMKQSEEYIANYTVAKATMSCDFNLLYRPAQVPLMSTIDGKETYVLDQFSTVMWTASSHLEPQYKIRYITPAGDDLSREEYDKIIADGGTAYRAAFIGCTYHCG